MNINVKTVRYGATINLGNFESERIDIEVELHPGQTPDEALEYARCWVKENTGKLPQEIQQQINDATSALAHQKSLIEKAEQELCETRNLRRAQSALISKNHKQYQDVLAKLRIAKAELLKVKKELGLPTERPKNAFSVWMKYPKYFATLENFIRKLKPESGKQHITAYQSDCPDWPIIDLWLTEFAERNKLHLYWELKDSYHRMVTIEVAIPFTDGKEWSNDDERTQEDQEENE